MKSKRPQNESNEWLGADQGVREMNEEGKASGLKNPRSIRFMWAATPRHRMLLLLKGV